MRKPVKEFHEHPILFSASMVRALRADKKTQTRRTSGLDKVNGDPSAWEYIGGGAEFHKAFVFRNLNDPHVVIQIKSPYGIAGDRLWTRESWAVGKCADGFKPSELAPRVWKVDNGGIWYLSDCTEPAHAISPQGKPRVSIFMPRWASRDNLELVDVRPERLASITDADARAEGIQVLPLQSEDDPSAWWQSGPGENQGRTPRDSFSQLFESINGVGSWDKNPWVWRSEFVRLKTPVPAQT